MSNTEHAETVRVVFSPIKLAEAQVTANHQLAALRGQTIENDADAQEANAYLRERARELDAVEQMLADTLAPVRETEKRIKALFQPTIVKCKEVVSALRSMLASYEKLRREQQRKALAEAAAVAQQRDPQKLAAALDKAETLAPQKLEGTSFVRTWKVERIARDLLPFDPINEARNFWTPDLKKIEAIGRGHKGDSPPVVPGVIWVEDFSPRVKR